MSYELYKVIHLAAIFVFLSGASALLLARPSGKLWKIVTGVATLVILITGFGLKARLGIEGFPGWMLGLLVIWLIVSMLGHIVAKRFPAKGMAAYWTTIGLSVIAAYLAVYKPF
jgi:uncharacterized membrane protein SirB2